MISNSDVDHYVEQDPDRPGPAEARLRQSGVHVWVLVAQLPAFDGDLDGLAAAYQVPREAVEAAMAYYRRHRKLIDAIISLNAA